MQITYNILMVVAVLVSVVFIALIFFTGKGDAMSGGGGNVRTTFRGKASFDDKVSSLTLWLGAAFIVLMLGLDFIAARFLNLR